MVYRFLQHLIVLFAGPVVLVGVSYWLAFGSLPISAIAEAKPTTIEALEQSIPVSSTAEHATPFRIDCERRAAEIRAQIGEQGGLFIQPPYVLIGDLPKPTLERYSRDVILPIERALSISYFDRSPDEPIVLVLASTEGKFQDYSERFEMSRHANYYGFYNRKESLAVLNIGSGEGTLAHELTHALAHVDFPELPEWFDEGLASLHEESRFSDDGLQLEGVSNWRLNYLQLALRNRDLPPLSDLLADRAFDQHPHAIVYAQARYFCMYLQKKGLLRTFYRKLRAQNGEKMTSTSVALEILAAGSLEEIDGDFQQWLESISSR